MKSLKLTLAADRARRRRGHRLRRTADGRQRFDHGLGGSRLRRQLTRGPEEASACSLSTATNALTGSSFRCKTQATRKYTRKGLPLEEMTRRAKESRPRPRQGGHQRIGQLSGHDDHEPGGDPPRPGRQEGGDGAAIPNGTSSPSSARRPRPANGAGASRASPVDQLHDGRHAGRRVPRRASSAPIPPRSRSGPNKGKRILPQAEDYARNLFKSLDADQKKIATSESNSANPANSKPKRKSRAQAANERAKVGKAVGLPAAKMNKDQKETLVKLIKSYTDRMAPRCRRGRK